MKVSLLFTLLVSICYITTSCREQKEPTAESKTVTSVNSKEKNITKTPESLEMINPDGTVNATLNCGENSKLETLIIDSQERNTENFNCYISYSNNLSISFEDEDQETFLTISLYGTGNMPYKKGIYQSSNSGSEQYATAELKDKNLVYSNTETFQGEVMINDYGMSSNILCGSFNITDLKGNKYIGSFNEVVSSF